VNTSASVARKADPTDTDVLVVGLGPVGATLANLLGRYGVKVLAIDQATEIFTKPRAIALDNEALRILQSAGVRPGEFSTVGIPSVQYHSPLFGRFARVNSARIVDCHPVLVTFYQPELEELLRRKVGEFPSVDVRLGTKLESLEQADGGVRASLRLRDGAVAPVRCRYLIGADGASSTVRTLLGLDFKGETFPQDWLIVDATGVDKPIDHIEFLCDPRRPTPHMVAPGNRQRWEFMLHPGEDPAAMEHPDTIHKLLAPWCDSRRIRIERTAVYRFHAREAATFSKGRCFLVGDAAHITPPFAGQGLVAGLRDVTNLGWKLAWVLRRGADPAILSSYDEERRPHARRIINLALFLGKLVMPRNRLSAFLVHGLVRAARLTTTGRAMFDDLKIKPDNRFDQGLFWRQCPTQHLIAGSTFPQGWVQTPFSSTPKLSDDVLGDSFALIGFGVDPAPWLETDLLARWHAAGGSVSQWCHRGQSLHLAPAERRIEAIDENVLPQRAPIGWVAIVRPDRCVMAEAPVESTNLLIRSALERIRVTPAPGTPAPNVANLTGIPPGMIPGSAQPAADPVASATYRTYTGRPPAGPGL
jgi:3-(3-hydroxy-phenyl)propionate hydroxylase